MSKIEVNAVEPQSGTTLTLGASGDTVALAAGALQTGFGRTGTVDWSSTIQTTGFTAVSGVGYFCDTSSAAFTVTLPANPSVGDIVAIKDWSSTAATNNIGIARNGQKIEGNTQNGAINVHGDAQTLVFSGTSRGWMVVNSGLLEGIQSPAFVTATGGTVLTCGNFKVHVFTGPGSFVVSCNGNDLGSDTVEYVVVAGGGGTVNCWQAGAGAGGFRKNFPSPAIAGFPVIATTYPITVGAGAAAGTVPPSVPGNSGSSSIFSTITSAGGGGSGTNSNGVAGGSGGGGAIGGPGSSPYTGGAGNTPPVSPPQGNSGGNGAYTLDGNSYSAGGGGGAGATGSPGSGRAAGAGGVGTNLTNPFFGPTAPSYGTPGPVADTRYFSGGGGAGGWNTTVNGGGYTGALGGAGGGGAGANSPQAPTPTAGGPGNPGTANTGGGGGGGGATAPVGTSGGSGIVMIRYKYQ
jgi:hypothetical protein